ncbi:MAG: DUF3794 domain-containing protein [Lachnospiraceae bacterium]
MELIKKNIHMDCMKCKATTQITLEDDINVSDNKPDIVKLIFDKGVIQIDEMKASTDHVQVIGKLLFAALYISEEEESRIGTIEGELPFREQVYLEGAQSGDTINIHTALEDLSISLINSRKLSVQAVLTLHLYIEEICDEETSVDVRYEEPVDERKPIEYRLEPMELSELVIQKKDVFRLKEEIALPQTLPNIFNLLWNQVCVNQIEFRAKDEKLSIQGELTAFFLYEAEGEDRAVRWYETTIPFEGEIECHGSTERLIPDIIDSISHCEVEVRPDFDGEERMIGIELVLDLQIKLYEQDQIELLTDVYGICHEVQVSAKEGHYKNLLLRNAGQLKTGEHIKVANGSARILQVCHSEAQVQPDETRIVENGIELTGSVLVKILYVTNDDATPFGIVKGSIPYHHRIEVPHIKADSDVDVRLSMEQLNVTMVDSEELDVKLSMNVYAIVFDNQTQSIITELRVTDSDGSVLEDLPSMVVYIAKKGDTLWQLGKRYYVPIAQIKETNELSDDTLQAGDKLLIVKTLPG